MLTTPCPSNLFGTAFRTALLFTPVIFNLIPVQAEPSPLIQRKLELLKETEVDSAALVLGETTRGTTRFGRLINAVAFQDAIVSFKGWQYTVYYDGARRLCLSRRQLSSGNWQTIRFSGYEFKTNDAHNVASIGICEKDGSIHLAYDGHGVPTYFRFSRAGVATAPEKVEWGEALFGPQRGDIQPGKMLNSISYPRFMQTHDGGLQFTYRVGGSGIGDQWMADYNPQLGVWENSRQIDTRNGDWSGKADGTVSASRNSYHNGFHYSSDGTLHTTWTWRERTPGANHDIAYAYSEDKGVTWKNNSGAVIGRATPESASEVMGIHSEGVVVVPISRLQGIINQQAQAVDSKGRVHVVMSHVTRESVQAAGLTWPSKATWGAVSALRYHHYMRENDGNWKHIELPGVAGGRGWVGFDSADNAYFVFLDRLRPFTQEDEGDIHITGTLSVMMATAKAGYSDWNLAYGEKGPFLSEFRPDPVRLKNEGVLSILTQRDSPMDVFTSSLSVVDLKLKP